jgi:hypothetical protein
MESVNSTTQHAEWRTDNFLTSAADRQLSPQEFRTQVLENTGMPPLTTEETVRALNELSISMPSYPSLDRLYADPPIPGQKFALFSFVPSKGATPDANGVYGMAKIRGSYDNNMELEQREDMLIRNVDSYHKIYRTFVGKPFPITIDPKYSHEVKEIDIRNKTTEVISQSIKQQKASEQAEIKEIKEREEKLKEDTSKTMEESDPMELYTTLVVKRAQLAWNYQEQLKKLDEVRDIIIRTRQQIKEMDEKDSSYRQHVYDKYMQARRDSGLADDDNSFIKYICEDISLPFDQVE